MPQIMRVGVQKIMLVKKLIPQTNKKKSIMKLTKNYKLRIKIQNRMLATLMIIMIQKKMLAAIMNIMIKKKMLAALLRVKIQEQLPSLLKVL